MSVDIPHTSPALQAALATGLVRGRWLQVSAALTTGVAQPLSLADALFAGEPDAAAPTGRMPTSGADVAGLVIPIFADVATETGGAAGQASLGTSAASQPYNDAAYAGFRGVPCALQRADRDEVRLKDVLSTAIAADANAKVYGYVSRRSDLGADLRYRLWFYYRRAADGRETPFTPDTSLTDCLLYVPKALLLSSTRARDDIVNVIVGQAASGIAAESITDALIAAANKDGAAGTPSMRTLGVGAGQAQAGDATLTAIAALGTIADRVAYTTGVDTWAETPLTAFARTILDDVDAPTARTTLGLIIGTDVQAFDATLLSLAALGTVADRIAYTTALDTWAEAPLTAFGRSLIDDVDAPTARTTLGVAIGTNVQAWDADLDAVAALATTGLAARTAAGTWATRTLTAPAAGLTIANPAGLLGDPTFALANDLGALEALGGTGFAARTGADVWAQRSLVAPAAGFTIADPAGVAGDPAFALANDLAAVEGLGGTGLAARTAADTWATRSLVAPAAGFTIADAGGVAGNPTFALADDLSAVEGLAALGIAVRSAASTWTTRSIAQTFGLTIANADGTAGNPTLAVDQAMTPTWTGTQTFRGRVNLRVREIAFADSPYAVAADDIVIVVNTVGGNVTVNLPAIAGQNERWLRIKHRPTGGTNKVILDGNGAETIDGAATYDLDVAYESVDLIGMSAEWSIVG